MPLPLPQVGTALPIPGVVETSNLSTNPGLEGGTLAGWTSNNATLYPLTLSAVSPISGINSALSTRSASTLNPTIGSIFLQTLVGGSIGKIPVLPSTPFTASIDIRTEVAAGSRQVEAWFEWYNASNVLVSSSTHTVITGLVPGAVQRISTTATAPATATQCFFMVTVSRTTGNAIAGERVWWDNLNLGDPLYFDGSTPDTVTRAYTWSSVVNASTSHRHFLAEGPGIPEAPVYPPTTLGVDVGTSDVRVTTHRFEVLDKDENLISILDTVQGGSIQWSAVASIHSGGSITVGDPDSPVDWLNVRIRPFLIVTDLESGAEEEYPQGVYLCAAPVEDWTLTGRQWNVELLDKLSILDNDIYTFNGLPATYTLPSGSNIIAAIVTLIASTGEETPAIEADPTATLAAAQTWDMGTTLLKIINDLLDTGNYFSLYCDERGQFRADKYIAPLSRAPLYEFESPFSYGELSRMDPSWTLDHDLYSVPNRFVLVGQGSDTVAAWVGIAINNNPNNKFSYQNRGRWITFVETGVEASSAEVLQASAERRLGLATSVTSTANVKHVFLPLLRMNGLIKFTNPGAGVELWCVIGNTEVVFDPIGLCATVLNEVTS